MDSNQLVGVIDYGVGNVCSISKAFEFLDVSVKDVVKETDIAQCSHIVLPGVGSFGYCATQLKDSGLLDGLEAWVNIKKKPLLGICVGYQLFAQLSQESSDAKGLSWLDGNVEKLSTFPGVKVPHVGWNSVNFASPFGDFKQGDVCDFYFDHSYAMLLHGSPYEVGYSLHGEQFSAIVKKENIVGAQFHPEKSQSNGLKFLKGFLKL